MGQKKLQGVATKKEKIIKEMEETWDVMEHNQGTAELFNKEVELMTNFYNVCRDEEEEWRIKSRSIWLSVGDRNITNFHKQAKSREMLNRINEIKGRNKKNKEG